MYDLELTWTGTHVDDGFISTTDTFSVHVIPEPSTLMFTALALLGSLCFLRRR